jgi:hypothetical protein
MRPDALAAAPNGEASAAFFFEAGASVASLIARTSIRF